MTLPEDPTDGVSVYHLYVLRVQNRDAKLAHLQQQGVGAGIHYPFPVHHLQAYKNVAVVGGSLRESESWAAECLSLPMFAELTEQQLKFVAVSMPTQRVSIAA
jgi:dTDP-4-amino-4,6-dideoxygalactose transaminase